jgi:glycosyltransferase involved in cell wall biosynthesis
MPATAISVVIPTHNRPELLAEALASVAAQSLPPAEVIVVDDASDPPVSPRQLDLGGIPVKLLRHDQARGGAAAKNTGVAAATGGLLAFLDDDDLYAPGYLAAAAAALAGHPELDVLFMGVDWFGRNAEASGRNYREAMARTLAAAGRADSDAPLIRFDRGLVAALLERVPMAFQRPVVRREAFPRIGPYEPHCLLWDCDWALRAALDGRAGLCPAGLYRQRSEGQGYSSRPERWEEQMLSVLEIRQRLGALVRQRHPDDRPLRQLFDRAIARSWFDLAYHHRRHGRTREALAAWLRSQRHAPDPRRLGLLLRILATPTGWLKGR